jgi:uncharacterized repeat protein (TIGR03803 family)
MRIEHPTRIGRTTICATANRAVNLRTNENWFFNTRARNVFVLIVLVSVFTAVLTQKVQAQDFTVLHSFSAVSGPYSTNRDGFFPDRLTSSRNAFYGTTDGGGDFGGGTLFQVTATGADFDTLHDFTCVDGCQPSGLLWSDNSFFGVTVNGGGNGTIFKINDDGTDFTTLHDFDHNKGDGSFPRRLVISDNTLYGLTMDESLGGGVGFGTIFAINTDGSGFATLYRFSDNDDGQRPNDLLVSGKYLYGTASGGSLYRPATNGTVFRMRTDGTGFQVLHSFSAGTESPTNNYGYYTNSEGSFPLRIILSGNTLYGSTASGGSGGSGTLFGLNIDGTGFKVIHSFEPWTPSWNSRFNTNGDGTAAVSLVFSGNTLYGAAQTGGLDGNGTIFALDTSGTSFQVLHRFSTGSTNQSGYYTNSDGALPATLVTLGNNLYGTAWEGGTEGGGTVFSVSLPIAPSLEINVSGPYVILSWPTNSVGFTFQSTSTLISPLWLSEPILPNIANGRNTITNALSGKQRFYRLSQ